MDGKIQCHFISNTHWDREWRYSAQRTRHMLSYMLDMVFDIFEKDPEFRYFHLDSQTMPIQDYLEVHPERAELVRKYVSEGRLQVGPWFCLPDEFCVGGESLVRNLLLGHRIAKRFGAVSKTGYSPFGWGQISQLPQLYLGFGIDTAMFYRGINTLVAPRSEFYWESPDGSRIIGSRLGARPRYNVWYVVHRPVFRNEKNENNRIVPWGSGGSPFRFTDPEKAELDYQYAHPRFEYHEEHVPERAAQAIREQDGDWTTPHRFWSEGHDSSCPDIRESRLIRDCNAALAGTAHVFHSTVKALQDGIRENARADWPVIRGEMRHPYTKGSVSPLMGWILSARTYVKQDNFRTERELTSYAEPLAVFASMCGAPYPGDFVDLAYNYLLQNHGHDSIGACGRDVVYDDVLYRSRQSREISGCVTERAMMDIAGDIDLSAWTPDAMALVVWNPAPFRRSETMRIVLDIPREWNAASFEILDDEGGAVSVQRLLSAGSSRVVQSPNDVANTLPVVRHTLAVEFPDIPALGYRTFRVVPAARRGFENPRTLRTSARSMENEYLRVTVNSNGTYDVYDRKTGREYPGLGYFRDSGEIGNPWEHIPPQRDGLFTTLGEKAVVTVVTDGKLETAFRISLDWALPEGRSVDETERSEVMKTVRIASTLTLRKGQPWLEVTTEIDNPVEDHYLRVSFPTGIAAALVHAQGQFDVVGRPVERPDYSKFDELPMTEHPMNSFVDASDGRFGLALLNEGLKAYEAHDDEERTVSLTLLRCFPLRICVTQDMLDYSAIDKGSQCLGKHAFRYAVMTHSGDWESGGVWQAAERFNLGLLSAQIGPSARGKLPLRKSFLDLSPAGIHVSAVKRSESGDGWVVRLFNPSDRGVECSLRLNGGFSPPGAAQSPVERVRSEFELPEESGRPWSIVRLVTLEELPIRDLEPGEDGTVRFGIPGKKIVTVEFLP